ncbi:MAG: PIN domain-containing protein [Luteitalea sp.]|nr:PIN domain-containing protein [Luteitalea sp.]
MDRRDGRARRVPFAFWDTSALLPLCGLQRQSAKVRQMARSYRLAVWWGTSVEATSGLYRLKREGTLTAAETTQALRRLHHLRTRWDEVGPSEVLRETAERLLARYKLRAGDALQLAAALEWCSSRPRERVFIGRDDDLSEAAESEGFTCRHVA